VCSNNKNIYVRDGGHKGENRPETIRINIQLAPFRISRIGANRYYKRVDGTRDIEVETTSLAIHKINPQPQTLSFRHFSENTPYNQVSRVIWSW